MRTVEDKHKITPFSQGGQPPAARKRHRGSKAKPARFKAQCGICSYTGDKPLGDWTHPKGGYVVADTPRRSTEGASASECEWLCACCYVNDAAIHQLALLTFNQLATKRAPAPRARAPRVPELDGLRECSGVGSSTDLSIGALGKRVRDDDADDVSAAAKRPRQPLAELNRAPPSASACAAASPPSAAAAASRDTPTAGTHAVVLAGPVSSTPGASAS